MADRPRARGRKNVTPLCPQTFRELVVAARWKQWLEENREALEAYNRFVERRGVFSDGLRRF